MGILTGVIPSDVYKYSCSTWFNIAATPDPLANANQIFGRDNGFFSGPQVTISPAASHLDNPPFPDTSELIFKDGLNGSCVTSLSAVSPNKWYHLFTAFDGTTTKNAAYSTFLSGLNNFWYLQESLFKIYLNLVDATINLTGSPDPVGKTVLTFAAPTPTITFENITTTGNSPAVNTLRFGSVPSWAANSVSISGPGIPSNTTIVGWQIGPGVGGLQDGDLTINFSGVGGVGSGVQFTVKVSTPGPATQTITDPWKIFSAGDAFNLGGDSVKIRYSDFQVWLGTYIDPSVQANLAKFVRVSGGRGTPADPSIAAAAFGRPAFRFSGNHTKFITNTGTAGPFTLTGSNADFTPGPRF